MITIFTRKELLVISDMKRQGNVRTILASGSLQGSGCLSFFGKGPPPGAAFFAASLPDWVMLLPCRGCIYAERML